MHMHEQIHAHFLELCAQGDSTVGAEHVHDMADFCKICFQNYTPQNHSLKLTALGHTIMQKMYECWSMDLDENALCVLNKGQTLLLLHKKMKAPYYWNNRKFFVYHSEHALEYEMVSRDFTAWIHSI